MALDLHSWLDRTVQCEGCGGVHAVATARCVVAADAPDRALPEFVVGELGARRALPIWDETTGGIAGERVRRALDAAGVQCCEAWVLPGVGGHPPTCDATTVEATTVGVRQAEVDVVVAVGSGTVNDVAKGAASGAGVPYVVVPTAASMNGYTSGIVALLDGGVKRTLPVAAVAGVFADPVIVGAAPAELTRAGLGDLLSKSVCGTDWFLSRLLLETAWCPLPGELVGAAEDASIAAAEEIGAGEPEAVGTLLQALMLSGISMVIAGSSAPASGGEHLFSHLIDMRRHATGLPMNLHGAQVGVGSIATAALYEQLLAYPVASRVDPDALAARHPTWEEEVARIERVHGDLAGEVLGCYRDKYRDREAHRAFVARIVARWPELRERAQATARPATVIRGALQAAGAPVTAGELGLSDGEAREVFGVCRDIRARYSVLDLAWDLGLLEELGQAALEAGGIVK